MFEVLIKHVYIQGWYLLTKACIYRRKLKRIKEKEKGGRERRGEEVGGRAKEGEGEVEEMEDTRVSARSEMAGSDR